MGKKATHSDYKMFPKYTKYLIVNVVFFTLVFGVGISDCTISSNHHHCILFSVLVPLERGNIYCQTGIQEIQIFKATNEY